MAAYNKSRPAACQFILFCYYRFLFSLFIIINNNNNIIIISYSGGQLDGSVAFLAACPYIIFICYFMYFWEIKMLACLPAYTYKIQNDISTKCNHSVY